MRVCAVLLAGCVWGCACVHHRGHEVPHFWCPMFCFERRAFWVRPQVHVVNLGEVVCAA